MKLLGLVGSLRKQGNCELIVKQISREITIPHELQLLRLPEYRLGYCNGCYRCLLAKRGCVLKDDLEFILKAICDADALILAAPTYFLAGPACLKAFIDRGISFYQWSEKLWGKPAVGIGIAGIEGKEGSTLLDIERFFSTLMLENRASRIIYAALPGESVMTEENLAVARVLARSLTLPSQPLSDVPSCSICGGQTFRFYANNRVKCMLCSETGTMAIKDATCTIEMESGEHAFLNDKTSALNHRDWLLGMLERFRAQKETLSKVRDRYKDDTPWISPGNNLKITEK